MRLLPLPCSLLVLLLVSSRPNLMANGFALQQLSSSTATRRRTDGSPIISLSATRTLDDDEESLDKIRDGGFVLSREEVNPIVSFGKDDKEKVVNAFGMWCCVVSLITGPVWAAAMTLMNQINQQDPDFDPIRAAYDKTGKIWAKTWLTMVDSFPTFSGNIDMIKENNNGQACLYVANHASWLDIPVLCTVLDPVFKFIAKGELRSVPCIGQQLVGGNHILIDREDRRSQLKTFKDGVKWLKSGVSLMAFPEGKRSNDGRLMEFKGGLFSMAVKTQVPIVPITISNAHAVMPGNSLFPVQSGRGKLHVHVHEPISTAGKSDAELSALVRECFLSTLPYEQHPLAADDDEADNEPPEITITVPEQHLQLQHHSEPASLASHNQHHVTTQQHHDHHQQHVNVEIKTPSSLGHHLYFAEPAKGTTTEEEGILETVP